MPLGGIPFAATSGSKQRQLPVREFQLPAPKSARSLTHDWSNETRTLRVEPQAVGERLGIQAGGSIEASRVAVNHADCVLVTFAFDPLHLGLE
jgi:hypothetical protein